MTRSEFRSHLRDLSATEFTEFVAAVWEARGYQTRVSGRQISVIEEDTGREKRLWTEYRRRWFRRTGKRPPQDVDIIVTNTVKSAGGPGAKEIVDGNALRAMTLYAIDRDTGRALFQEFFGRDLRRPVAPSPSLASRVPDELAMEPIYAVIGGIALVLIVASIFAGPLALGEPTGPETPSLAATNSSEVTFVTPTPTPRAGPGFSERYTPLPVDPGVLPPGISRRGIEDTDTLIRAHVRGIRNRSYRLRINYREFSNGSFAVKRETIRIENKTTYLSEIDSAGKLSTNPYVIDDKEVYADGNRRYERHLDSDERTYTIYSDPTEGRLASGTVRTPFSERTQQYLRWFLAAEESRISDTIHNKGDRYYQIVMIGDPWIGFENSTGVAIVDSHGVVHYLQRTYDIPGAGDTWITVRIQYSNFDEVTVEEPWWYAEARESGFSLDPDRISPSSTIQPDLSSPPLNTPTPDTD